MFSLFFFAFCSFYIGSWWKPEWSKKKDKRRTSKSPWALATHLFTKTVATADWVMKTPEKLENDPYGFQFYSPAISPSFLLQRVEGSPCSPSLVGSARTLLGSELLMSAPPPKRNPHYSNASDVLNINWHLITLMITKSTIWMSIQGGSHVKIVENHTKVVII